MSQLPPLPEPVEMDGARWGYDAEQMTAYAEQAIEDFRADLAQALCDDCENGVRWLNERAAERFRIGYPHLSKAIGGAK